MGNVNTYLMRACLCGAQPSSSRRKHRPVAVSRFRGVGSAVPSRVERDMSVQRVVRMRPRRLSRNSRWRA